jgi:ABC-type Na+ efflux pump permease subunit
MRVLAVFRKALLEQLRELWLLALLLGLTPFFVVVFAGVFGAGAWTYRVAVVSHDEPVTAADGRPFRGGEELTRVISEVKNATGSPALTVATPADEREAERMLTSGKAHALVVIPSGFSRAVAAARERRAPVEPRPVVVYEGDMTSQSYMVAAVLAVTAVTGYLEAASGQRGPVDLAERPLGGSGARSELDMALPGIAVSSFLVPRREALRGGASWRPPPATW